MVYKKSKSQSRRIGSQKPLVSIILPVKNGEDFIAEALDSMISQTYTNWEMIVINDGSKDKTAKILSKYKKICPKINVLTNKESIGISKALNLGIKKAKGQFLARMDADDISYPSRIAKQVEYLQENHRVVAVGTQCDVINEHGDVTGMKLFPTTHREIYDTVFSFNPLQHPTLMINCALVPDDFVYYDDLDGAEDLSLLFKIFPYGKVHNMQETLLAYRIHSANVSFQGIKQIYHQAFRARIRGVLRNGYKPSIASIFMTIVQTVAIILLPESAIKALYMYARGISSALPGFAKGKIKPAYRVK